jgi:RNA polymerase sigma-70 factor (ECF subfamily)
MGPSNDPQEILERVQSREDVRAAVFSLPPRLREPTILHYFEELSVETIAEILDLAEVNVKSRLLRGRQRLRRKLEEGATPSAEVQYTYIMEGRADGTGGV